MIANLALWFGIRVLFGEVTQVVGIDVPVPASLDPYALALGGLAFFLLLVWHKGVPLTLLVCAMAGAGLRMLI